MGGSAETPHDESSDQQAHEEGAVPPQEAVPEQPTAGQGAYPDSAYVSQDPYGQAPNAQKPNGQAAYGTAAHAPQNPYGQNPAQDQNPYGQNPVQDQGPYGQAPVDHGSAGAYAQGAYGQGADPQAGYPPHGAPFVQGAPTAGYPQPASRPPMDPKKKKMIILFSALAAGLVLLLVIGSIVINVIGTTQYGPEAKVKEYLSAISQGKASQANKLVDPGVTKNAAALLSDDVLGDATALMKNAKVTDVTTRGESAYAEVSYSVDGTAYDDIIELSKDGKEAVLFDNWKIDKPLLSSVYVYTDQGTTVSVNGTDIDFGKEYELAAYPAAYEIGAPEGDFFEAETQAFVAGTGSKASYEAIDVEFVPSEGLTTAVQEALNKHLDTCATSTTDDPEGCGMYTGATYDFSNEPVMKYTVDKYPVVTVDESGSNFTTEGGKVSATATGTTYSGETATDNYATDAAWGLGGSIVIEGDEVTLEDIY
jgi:hypothetical protein